MVGTVNSLRGNLLHRFRSRVVVVCDCGRCESLKFAHTNSGADRDDAMLVLAQREGVTCTCMATPP
jgi:hypothetical protein